MDIIKVLRQEETKLQKQLSAVQQAIGALNGGTKRVASPGYTSGENGSHRKQTVSAAARAKMSKKAKERWARIRAEKAKKAK
jgi:hypothetical protein